MLITITNNARCSEDGFTVRRYMKGQTCDLPYHVAQRFFSDGNARPATPAEIETFKAGAAA